MAVENPDHAIRMIMYLTTQSDYVTIHDIHKDPLSGFESHEEIKPALKLICDVLEVKMENDEQSLYRLPRTFDGYRDVFSMVANSEHVYSFLSSNYSQSILTPEFIREALVRVTQTPYFSSLASKYPEKAKPGDTLLQMLAQNPGYPAIAAMFGVSPAVATKLLFPETMSKYELTHPKICLDLTFAADMVKRAPPGTVLSVKYEIVAQGMINMQTSGGTGIP
ncbi:hypothetical protein [Methanocella sp. MCL-LM]|uniref:hypothetical protein n=1 Tax=Methanocella sp. MCL-LM TaxID=3412035 RepID=UPI003C757DB4